MKDRKIHYRICNQTACGRLVREPLRVRLTTDPDLATCKKCIKSIAGREMKRYED